MTSMALLKDAETAVQAGSQKQLARLAAESSCSGAGLPRITSQSDPRTASDLSHMGNILLERAAHHRPLTTKRGVLYRLFTLMFKGFVYNQIWEEPRVDLDALALQSHHRLITIASGGCNVLNYLAAGPARVIAVDLNPNHVALTRLKLQALQYLPDYDAF